MKIPQYMDKVQCHVVHPRLTLRDAAKALEIDAAICRKDGWTQEARALRDAARKLRAVADGSTYAQAFNWIADARPKDAPK